MPPRKSKTKPKPVATSKFKLSRVPPELRFFFSVTTTDGVVYTCNSCSDTPKCTVGTGYINLRKHLIKCVGDDYDAKFASAMKSRGNALGFEVIEYVGARDLVVYKWVVWVLMRNMPLSEVDNPLTRELAGISSSDHVSSRSLSTYIKYLVPLVEGEVEKILPQLFGILFDGWTHSKTHFIAVFATFVHDNKCREVLLGFSPPLDEQSYTAEAQRDLIAFVLKVYNRSLSNVSVLIGDNCPTNKATADMLGVRLIGCACHKLNLAIQKLIAETPGASDAIARVRSMVVKSTNLKAAAALRDLTELTPLLNNDTRWSSTYRMIERFFKIEKELRLVDEVEVPRNAEVQVLRDLMPKLEKLDSIMVDLQTQGTTVADARGTLDIVLDDFPELSHYLAQDAAIFTTQALNQELPRY